MLRPLVICPPELSQFAYLLCRFAEGDQEHDALPRGMRREKIRRIIIEKGKPRGPLGAGHRPQGTASRP
jgi:hypothetical protein